VPQNPRLHYWQIWVILIFSMFGISFPEFLVVAVMLIAITKPKDIPEIARRLAKLFYKAKNILAHSKMEINKVGKDLGLEEIKTEALAEIEKEREELRKTTIIDLYGNEHEVHDVEKIRGDLAKEDLYDEIDKCNEVNS
jgi:Sec-independent protein translocase protein TatA